MKIQRAIQELSRQIIEAQKPIHILDAVKWDDSWFEWLKSRKFKALPPMDAEFYQGVPLGFEPKTKKEEFQWIEKQVQKKIGNSHPVSKILLRNCEEYRQVIEMLEARGTPQFYQFSKRLFGSTEDTFRDDHTTVKEMGILLNEILESIGSNPAPEKLKKDIPAAHIVKFLKKRLQSYFEGEKVNVKLSDGILSDASAGSDYIKIKKGVFFSEKDVRILEVHEGWVHIGTTLNGSHQKYASWLSKGPPCTTAIQEGLAVLMEIFSFVSTPERARKINNRVIACHLAEQGANLLDVIQFFQDKGLDEWEAYKNAQRIFRGGVVSGKAPFTKDISYCKGFVMTYNFIRSAIRWGKPEILPFLFAGKVTLEDVPVLYELYHEGIVEFPKHLPPQFQDYNGLMVWMAFSNFLNKMSLEKISEEYRKLIAA